MGTLVVKRLTFLIRLFFETLLERQKEWHIEIETKRENYPVKFIWENYENAEQHQMSEADESFFSDLYLVQKNICQLHNTVSKIGP